MRPLAKGIALGLVTAIVGTLLGLLPFALHLEEDWGLALLFHLRGPRQPPPEVVVVGIDRESAERLGVAADAAQWPRALHARLIEILADRGAAVIAFDVVFERPHAADEDRRLGEAIERAGRVVLGAYLVRETVPVAEGGEARAGQVLIERLLPPPPGLADQALGVAPFPLPKLPVRVSQYWTFKVGAGDIPTLPAVALQVFALERYEAFARLFEEASPYLAERLPRDRAALVGDRHLEQVVRLVREMLQHDPAAAGRMRERLADPRRPLAPADRRVLAALVRLYAGAGSVYLNFYGPPGTIPIIPFHRALAAPPPDVAGKAVFVGLSQSLRPGQTDGFHTVYSQPTGADLSGVEIAATAFANLLEGRPVEPLAAGWHVAVLLLWGLGAGLLCRLAPTSLAAPALVAAGLLYLVAVQQQFRSAGRWYPLAVPLLVEAPVAFVGGLLWRYADAHQERQKLRAALGYYVPSGLAELLARQVGHVRSSELVQGICLATDVSEYSRIAEKTPPEELRTLMNRYYHVVFEPIRRQGGLVGDLIGDTMLALWTRADPPARSQACQAALEVARAVDRFNAAEAVQLPTRIGLHAGPMSVGGLGAIDHYEYRPLGDIVNTATRLEGLNKHLGTRVLASEEVLRDVPGLLTRELGTFLPAGKSNPVVVHELLGPAAEATAAQRTRCAAFGEALSAYRGRRWTAAIEAAHRCLAVVPDDGPARFYLQRCEQYTACPPPEPWDGVVRMESK
jgi:adenylate cyclase